MVCRVHDHNGVNSLENDHSKHGALQRDRIVLSVEVVYIRLCQTDPIESMISLILGGADLNSTLR